MEDHRPAGTGAGDDATEAAIAEARAEDARLVAATNAGDAEAFGLLYDRWFDRVHDLARRITRDDEAAADVAQDAFVTAWNRLDGLRDPDAFGGWLLRITRNRALDRVRSAGRVQLEEQGDVSGRVDDAAAADRMVDLDAPEAVAEDRELQALVLEAAEALGERDATALHLQLRHGLTPAEVGDVLGMNRNAANQLVYRVRDRLGDAVRGRVLWRDGRPRCERLRRELDDKGITTFDRQAVRVSNRHAQQCDECEERRRLRLAPAALFRAVPVAVAPVSIKQHAAQALAEQGVPMVGSVHGTGPGGGPAAERSWARRHADALAGVVAAAVVLALVLLFALTTSAGDDDVPVVAERTGTALATTTTTDTTTTTTSTSTAPTTSPPAPTPQPDAPPAPQPDVAPPAPPPPAPPTGSISVSPSSAPPVYPTTSGPVVAWSSSGAATVSVSGPGLSSGSASGGQPVCPGTLGTGSVCQAAPGTYEYVLTVTNAGGSQTFVATLTIS